MPKKMNRRPSSDAPSVNEIVSEFGEHTIGFPATFAGTAQARDGMITLRLELDASQLPVIAALGSAWLDRGLLVAITPALNDPIAGG